MDLISWILLCRQLSNYFPMIQLGTEEMVSDAFVPAPLAAGLMHLLRSGKYQVWLKAVSKKGRIGRGREEEREPLLTIEMIKQGQSFTL